MKPSPLSNTDKLISRDKAISAPTTPLHRLFFNALEDIFDAETRLAEALPNLVNLAVREVLKEVLLEDWTETKGHVLVLQNVFKAVGRPPKKQKCHAMVGLLKEANEVAKANAGTCAMNAAIISVVQKMKHYQIASYGTLYEWAFTLGNSEATSLLERILKEEKNADERLTDAARTGCNVEALSTDVA
jgi:ferritin-like metal-binding protein YciE